MNPRAEPLVPVAGELPIERQRFHVAVLPGDGIGVEVTREARRVLQALEAVEPDVDLTFHEYAVGVTAYLRGGDPLPAATLEACARADAVLLGAMGLPNVRWPDGRELTPQIDLREKLDLYCGLRPVRLFHAQDSPLKEFAAGDLDLLLVRENCEGLFSTRHTGHSVAPDRVCDLLTITRPGTERIARAAFRQARKRRHHVTLVDKANVLPSMVFFRRIFDEVAKEFPDVETDHVYVDAASLYLIKDPRRFDVLLTENLFGDILSDLIAGLVGGMGLAPSADLGDDCAVFQPSHGTAPDIAGKGIANPTATVLSAAMMLEYLRAEEQGRRYLCRTAASFVASRLGLEPRPLLEHLPTPATQAGGLLVVGSHVPRSTEQLERLRAESDVVSVELSVGG